MHKITLMIAAAAFIFTAPFAMGSFKDAEGETEKAPKKWVYTSEMLEARLRDAIQANNPEESVKWAQALAQLTIAMNQEQLSRANKAAAEMSARVMNIIKQAPVFIEGLKKAYPKDRELQANLPAVELLLKASTEVVDSKEVLAVLSSMKEEEIQQCAKDLKKMLPLLMRILPLEKK